MKRILNLVAVLAAFVFLTSFINAEGKRFKNFLINFNNFCLLDSKAVPTKPVLNSWLEITNKDSWPLPESKTDHQPFYVFHPDTVRTGSKLFGFNRALPKKIKLFKNLDFLFKYWSNNDLGRFRSTDKNGNNNDILLENTNKQPKNWWKYSQTEHISKEQWSNYSFINGDDFVLAFKDVKVKHLSLGPVSSLSPNPIHGYKTIAQASAIAPINDSKHVILIDANRAEFTLQPPIELTTAIDELTFQFVTFPNEYFEKITLNVSKNCDAKLKNAEIKCKIEDKTNNGKTIKILKSFEINLKNNQKSFAIMKPELKNIEISKDITLKTISSSKNYYSVSKSTLAYLYKINSQPDGQDMCYTLLKPDGTAPFEIYFTFENLTSGFHLTTTVGPVTKFCINDYIALNNIEKFQLTFLIPTKVANNFDFFLQSYSKNVDFQLKSPTENDQLKKNDITKGWYYSNDLFDYTINSKSTQKPNDQAKLWACDIIVNCFQYDLIYNESTHTGKYTLKNTFKNVINKSPFIRIKSDRNLNSESKNTFVFVYFKQSVENVFKEVTKQYEHENPNHKQDKLLTNSYVVSTSKSDKFEIKVPIDSVDLRAFNLRVIIEKKNGHQEAIIKTKMFTFTSENADLLDIGTLNYVTAKTQNPDFRVFSFTTNDFFYVNPFQTENKFIKGLFTIQLDVELKNNTQSTEFFVKLDLESNKLFPKITKATTNDLNVKKKVFENSQTMWLFSNFIQSPFDRKIPPFNITFKLKSKEILQSTDFQVTQIILSQGQVQKKVLDLTIQNTTATFEETNNENLSVKGPVFQLVYLIELKNKSQKVNVSVTKFELNTEQGPKSTQSGFIISTVNTKFDQIFCSENIKMNAEKTACSLDKVYQKMETTCVRDGCSNIFDPPLTTSEIYFEQGKHANRYFPTKVESTKVSTDPLISTIEIKKPENAVDFCVSFAYQSVDSLFVSAAKSHQNPLSFRFASSLFKETKTLICASWLTPNTPSSLYIRFDSQKVGKLGTNYISNFEVISLKENKNRLESGLYQNKLTAEQFINWEINSSFKVTNNFINFTLNDAQKMPKNIQTWRLYSKWIKKSLALNSEIKIFVVPSGNVPLTNVSLYILSSTKKQKELTLDKLQSGKMNHINFTTSSEEEYFQFVLKVTLDLTQIEQTSLNLKIADFALNDPCIDDNSGKQKNCNHGICSQQYDTFKNTCTCATGYTPETDCQKIDYCLLEKTPSKANKQICSDQGLKCKSIEDTESFECSCKDNSTRWDTVSSTCLPLKSNCKEHESYKIVSGKQGCYCDNGFIKINNTCIEFDPCNKEHQKPPCKDSNAECSKLGSKNSDFQCVCKADFYNEFANKGANAKCKPAQCKSCEQICKLNSETKVYSCECKDENMYTLEGDKCILKDGKQDSQCKGNQTEKWISKGYPAAFLFGSSCTCPENFSWNNQKKICEISSKVGSFLSCSKVELKSEDHAPGCVCLNGQKFDLSSRKCLSQCDEEYDKKCKERDSFCVVSNNKVQCKCKPGFVAFGDDPKNANKSICLDKCTLFNKQELMQYKCSRKFSRCDSAKVTISNTIEDVFILNVSKVTSSQNDHCGCEIGFQLDKSSHECVPSLEPIRYIKNLDFLLDPLLGSPAEKSTYTENTIKPAFTLLINSLFGKVHLASIECTLNDNKAICTAAIHSKMTVEKVKEKLENACQFSGETGGCSYLTADSNFVLFSSLFSNYVNFNSVLKRDKKEISVEPIDVSP